MPDSDRKPSAAGPDRRGFLAGMTTLAGAAGVIGGA